MNEWFSATDLAGLAGMPSSPQGVNKKARQELWKKKQQEGKQGKAYEYLLTSLPPETQQALKIQYAKSLKTEINVTDKAEKGKAERYVKEALWQPFDKATAKQKSKAETKYHACVAVENLVREKTPLMEALEIVANAQAVSIGSLKNWYYKVRNFEQSDWLAVLLTRSGKTAKEHLKAEFDLEAWDVFLADYLRPEKPTLAACYERLKRSAQEMGWQIPS
ncbi:transposase [[Haemophilus] ducreyi]|nr:transposase [[Haemophilus] ducreyi]